MSRALIILLDSFGIGATKDAAQYGDAGANTLLHIAEHCAKGMADHDRAGPLTIPNLTRLGLNQALQLSCGHAAPSIPTDIKIEGAYGFATELSHGKDTPSGHWELAGVPVLFDWGYFPPEYPSFPQKLLDELIKRGQLPGVL